MKEPVTPRERNEQIYREASSGDANAYAFIKGIIGIAHVWDDLIDKDVPVSDDQINGAFTTALLTFGLNPFYVKWRAVIDPVLSMSIINWRAATSKERAEPCEWSYIMRSDYANLIVLTKMLTSDWESAVKFAQVVRDDTHHEGMTDYKAALVAEELARR